MDTIEPAALEQTDSAGAGVEAANQVEVSTEMTKEEKSEVSKPTEEKGLVATSIEAMATPEEPIKMDCESSAEVSVACVVREVTTNTSESSKESLPNEDTQESTVYSSALQTNTVLGSESDSQFENPPAQLSGTSNGLSLLAAYSSDTDSDVEEIIPNQDDDVVEVPVTGSTAYRRSEVAASSSSESEESSSDSDSNSEGEYLTVLKKKIEKRINTEDCDEEDDEDFDEDEATGNQRPRGGRRQPPKVRGEMLLDDLPPIHQLEITVPEDECIELGKVQSIVDQLVLVNVLPNSMLFDLDTVLFLEKGRKVLGQVFDVLGQVADPIYCVRFNSHKQIEECGIKVGDVVYCAPKTEHTQFVILSKLMQVRGSDASWEHDVEPPERYIDYSDDEAEREARQEQRKRRQRDRTNSTDSVDTVNTETSSVPESVAPPPARQRGRRAQRAESFRQQQQHREHYQHQRQQQNQNHQQQPPDPSSQYNYHPSYNPGSWHSNYYHNFHPPPNNFNMPPQPQMHAMHFPVPNYGYGVPMMGMMPPMAQMYPPPPGFGQQPPSSSPQQNHRQDPRSGR